MMVQLDQKLASFMMVQLDQNNESKIIKKKTTHDCPRWRAGNVQYETWWVPMKLCFATNSVYK